MLTLFRVATFEDWTDAMCEAMEYSPLSWIFFVSFIFLAAFVFLNMMIGIVLEVMQREHLASDLAGGPGPREPDPLTAHLNERQPRIEELLNVTVRRE